MTDAQWKIELDRVALKAKWEFRAFRKECVTRGIVRISRENGSHWYTVRYRDRYVATLFGGVDEKYKLMTLWNVIEIAEETIEKIEGVKHESN